MRLLGNLLIFAGIMLLLFIFSPVAKEYLEFKFDQWRGISYSLDALVDFPQSGVKPIVPVDTEFGIVIPKIHLNAEIFPDIDPLDPAIYLPVLKKGVAHAQGSSFPGEKGSIFLFGHSTDAFYNVSRYNAVFFLINELEKNDEIDLFFKDRRYIYKVIDKKIVPPGELKQAVEGVKGDETLILQTCFPPGTTLKRLLVVALRSR